MPTIRCCPLCYDDDSDDATECLLPPEERGQMERTQENRAPQQPRDEETQQGERNNCIEVVKDEEDPQDREGKQYVERRLLEGAERRTVKFVSHRKWKWGGQIDYNDPIYMWQVTKIEAGKQFHAKSITENCIFLSIRSEVPTLKTEGDGKDEEHPWLEFKKANRKAIMKLLLNGEPCEVKFLELPDYNQQDCFEKLLTCPKKFCQCFCPLWCPPDEEKIDIRTRCANIREAASRTIMEDQEKEARDAMYCRRRCTCLSSFTEFLAFFAVFCTSVTAYLAGSKVFGRHQGRYIMLGSGMAGVLSLALYKLSDYCKNQSNEYTEDVNSFISKNRLPEFGVTHYDKNAEAQVPQT